MLRKDVEDQLRAVHDPLLDQVRDVPQLRRRQIAVEEHEPRTPLPCADDDVAHLSLADQVARIWLRPTLSDTIHDHDARRRRELAHLLETLLRAGVSPDRATDQYRPLAPCLGRDAALRLPEAVLQIVDPLQKVEVELPRVHALVAIDQLI